MNEENLLVACEACDNEPGNSFTVRSDNLATLSTYEGCHASTNKHSVTISEPFILTRSVGKTILMQATHIAGLSKRTEFNLPKDKDQLNQDVTNTTTCIYSMSKQYVAAGMSNGTVCLWRACDGALCVKHHMLHSGAITALCIDYTSWILFAASSTGEIGACTIPDLYNATEEIFTWSDHTLAVTDLVSTPGGRVYSVSLDKTLKCFDFSTKCLIFSVNFNTAITCCALAHNETVMYCGGVNGSLYSIHLVQDIPVTREFEGHENQITDLTLGADDRSLYSISLDKTIRRWDTATGQTINRIQIQGTPFGLRWIPSINALKTHSQKNTTKDFNAKLEKNKPFPTLSREIKNDKEVMVSAHVDDLDILSIDEEFAIAMADISSGYTMGVMPEDEEDQDNESTIEAIKQEETRHEDPDIELKRANGILYQYILSQQK